jgi:hypothetical protein
MGRRIALLLSGWQVVWVKNPEYLIGGSLLLSKGGSLQMSAKDPGTGDALK